MRNVLLKGNLTFFFKRKLGRFRPGFFRGVKNEIRN
uniref:Uncharacterized protein n=1 Tax=Myoviridae sp. ctk6V34 TaxID=2825164 RepID=A0A8S5V3K4_9CAUD|nr:MAG TPA: hypothetical protein [Myoviridae sp. ctk6V34]